MPQEIEQLARRLRALYWAMSRPASSHAEIMARYHEALDFGDDAWPTVDPHAEGSWHCCPPVLLG